jgi:nucleotide-binding universal stress UspA family protein
MSSVKLDSIVSAVDFSEPSRNALRWAGALASRFHSRLTVVSIVEPLLAEAARIRLGQDLAQTETEPALREFVAATWPDGTGASQTVFRVSVGESAPAILAAAAAASADLIVMGTQGLGGLRKWLVGSTTERLLRQTQVPVLAVPPPRDGAETAPQPGSVSHIVAAIDFSAPSAGAARMAADLATAFSARLTLAHVVEPLTVPRQWEPIVVESDETRVAAARTRLAEAASEACGGRACDQLVVLGRPAEQIGSIAVAEGALLIVMGLAGAHGAFAPRPGSIAYQVLSSGMIPVLVLPSTRR